MRVMVVDDDRSIRDIIAYGVGQVSVVNRVVAIADAETALQNFKVGEFDCLVVDYKLPGMNGVEFIKEIRRKDDNVGIVLITAVLDQEKAEDLCEGLDVYAVVLKPFSNRQLSEKIQAASELARIPPLKKAKIEDALESQSVRMMDLGTQIQAQITARKHETTRRAAF